MWVEGRNLHKFITALKRSLRRLCFHRCLSVHGRRGWECIKACTGQGACIPACTGQGGVCQGGVCPGGLLDQRQTPPQRRGRSPPRGYYGIRSTSGRYASHWKAFLLEWAGILVSEPLVVREAEQVC